MVVMTIEFFPTSDRNGALDTSHLFLHHTAFCAPRLLGPAQVREDTPKADSMPPAPESCILDATVPKVSSVSGSRSSPTAYTTLRVGLVRSLILFLHLISPSLVPDKHAFDN